MCMIEDGEPMHPSATKTTRSRANRSCSECGGQIRAGQDYERTTGLSDGKWWTFATCMRCVNGPRQWLSEECGGWCYGGVLEDIREHISERHGWGEADAGLMELKRYEAGMRWRKAMAA